MSAHTIRAATLKDHEAIKTFNIAMALETEGKRLWPEAISQGVKTLIATPAKGFYLVAEKEGEVVGSLLVTKEWSDWRNGEFWWIQSVYVVAPHRRQGIYSDMYRVVKEMALVDGHVCGFRLYVEKDNEIAQRTYSRLGMQETHYKLFEEMTDGG